jgi:hypothetical protein
MPTKANLQMRFFNFLVFCIPVRLALVYIAWLLSFTRFLPLFGIPFLIFGLGFLYLYMFELRQTGIETGGEAIWWHNIRPVHGFLLLLFSILAIENVKDSLLAFVICYLFFILN